VSSKAYISYDRYALWNGNSQDFLGLNVQKYEELFAEAYKWLKLMGIFKASKYLRSQALSQKLITKW
jgi:hypothetical protein